jgi:hypothetical protein
VYYKISRIMELGHLLTRSGLTYPEVSSKVYHDSFCQLGNSVSLPWVIYYVAFYSHVVSSFSCIPVICLKLVLFLIPLRDIIVTNITVKLNSKHYLPQPYRHTSKRYDEEILGSLNNPFLNILYMGVVARQPREQNCRRCLLKRVYRRICHVSPSRVSK